jgi:hypothetical protein
MVKAISIEKDIGVGETWLIFTRSSMTTPRYVSPSSSSPRPEG